MFVELIGMFVVGVVGVGLVMLINCVLGGCLLCCFVLVVVGVVMLVIMIFNEYGWYDWIRDFLFEGIVVVQMVESMVIYCFWIYVKFFVECFVVVDVVLI